MKPSSHEQDIAKWFHTFQPDFISDVEWKEGEKIMNARANQIEVYRKKIRSGRVTMEFHETYFNDYGFYKDNLLWKRTYKNIQNAQKKAKKVMGALEWQETTDFNFCASIKDDDHYFLIKAG